MKWTPTRTLKLLALLPEVEKNVVRQHEVCGKATRLRSGGFELYAPLLPRDALMHIRILWVFVCRRLLFGTPAKRTHNPPATPHALLHAKPRPEMPLESKLVRVVVIL